MIIYFFYIPIVHVICNLDFFFYIDIILSHTLKPGNVIQLVNLLIFFSFLAKETSTGFTPRASESNNKTTNGIDLDSDDDDDDMSDIFERARKKYNLEIDDETMSRSRKWCHWVTKLNKIIEQSSFLCNIDHFLIVPSISFLKQRCLDSFHSAI